MIYINGVALSTSFENIKKAALYAVDNLTKIAFGLLSVSLIAHVYGPENLGRLSLVQSITSILMFLPLLGLDHFVVRDLSRNPNDGELLGTVTVMQFSGWLIYVMSSFLTLMFMGKFTEYFGYFLILAIVALQTLLSNSILGRLYYQAINKPKEIARSAFISRIIAAVFIVLLTVLRAEYIYVILYLPIQAFIQFVMLLKGQLKNTKIEAKWKFSKFRAISLLKECYPIILAAMLFPLFTHFDSILVASYLGEKSLGAYAAARNVILQFIFFGSILTMTFYSSFARMQIESDQISYTKALQGLGRMLFVGAFVMSLCVFICREPLVDLLYGQKFRETTQILSTQVWIWLFIIPAALYSRLLVLHGLAKYELIKSLLTAILSVSLNFIFIPQYGVQAASVVAVFSYFIADFAVYSFFRETRPIFIIAFKSMFSFLTPKVSIDDIKFTLSRK